MTNATKSQKVLDELLGDIDRKIIIETEWAEQGYDDTEYSNGRADMAKELRERLIILRSLVDSDFIELHEQLGE